MLVKANNAANEGGASLSSGQLEQLQQTVSQYSPLQLAWASGYLAAKSEQPAGAVATAPAAVASQTLTILYGSQTGNAKGVAEQVFAAAEQQGIGANLVSMADFKPKSLKSESHVLLVVSTHGEGEPPDDAMALHEFVFSKRAPKLDGLSYAVLALGDSSYEYFCQTGKDFDERFAALGGKRLFDRLDCDVDYDEQAKQWQEKTLTALKEQLGQAQSTAQVVNLAVDNAPTNSVYNKQNPFLATVIDNQKITGRDSNKTVQHIELDLEGSGLTYQPGDALGIWPENDDALVTQLLAKFNLDTQQQVTLGEMSLSLAEALREHKEITAVNKVALAKYALVASNEALDELMADAANVRDYLNSTQFIDIVSEYPATISAQQLVDLLPALAPRLYSIASSQEEVEEEVHLTVGLVEYGNDDERRLGAASGFLIERLKTDDTVKVFIESNNNFRLPENNDTKVIMIGPGTGVAPFRAFMQHRDALGAEGDNWLFFGDQTFTQDFLYQVEWQAHLKSGLLSQLDVAFSRDQAEKVYVQHKLLKHGEKVMQWLEQGAHLYICGDMSRMAKDVHQALVDIIVEHGNKSAEQAEQYLKQLRIEKRYQKDVY